MLRGVMCALTHMAHRSGDDNRMDFVLLLCIIVGGCTGTQTQAQRGERAELICPVTLCTVRQQSMHTHRMHGCIIVKMRSVPFRFVCVIEKERGGGGGVGCEGDGWCFKDLECKIAARRGRSEKGRGGEGGGTGGAAEHV